ncbi:FG-GAP-like repeat-containing protein [Pelotalea chapellei]|uniref:VCBS repeat-containing protein n=1 Tax=Pelotalea chapellei TaxID=44671 RepID=A0ABS5U5M5_9BACT|nr:FG-GAP-like repeat-containing protein [Pelotalea chapellei]MBT1070961.1 VCBS repeat-containing protein [Pelotalea chapellei]
MRYRLLTWSSMTLAALALVSVCDQSRSLAAPITAPGSIPDYFETPNWANSPPLKKFVDTLAPLGDTAGNCGTKNTLGQCLPIAVPDTLTYPGSDYYEIELVEYRERLHSDFTAVTLNAGSKINATTGGTKLRGYRQVNTDKPELREPHYLGPIILATKDKPVRIKFTNKLPVGANGKLFVPTDTTVMGSGKFEINYNPVTKAPYPNGTPSLIGDFTENRATLHLHGGRTPWISDGTTHQWTAPVGENAAANYPKGMSVSYVPDMWFDKTTGATVAACKGQTTCNVANSTNNPGEGSMTFYYTNQQSGRLMFYHDHAWGITRLNVYVGEAAGYIISDPVEQAMISGGQANGQGRSYAAGTIPPLADTIPLIIQDKTFVDPLTIKSTDPTWAWGSQAPTPVVGQPASAGQGMNPVKGDLWWPHVYMPAQNPFNPDLSGVNAMGRWHYGPWFYPPTPTCGSSAEAVKPYCIEFGPVPNEHYFADPNCSPVETALCNQPPERPGTPNTSWGAEAFLDTMMVNGTVYPKLDVAPKKYRLRILNASHDRFLNLQLYQADGTVNANADPVAGPICAGACATNTEVKMVIAQPRPVCGGAVVTNCTCPDPAVNNPAGCFPDYWAADSREGGVPDPALRGPAMIQIGTEGGFLPAPVVLNNKPVTWNLDPTMFNVGNVDGGTLLMGPAERADIIVDFTNFAGKTLILYNDAPTAFPALDPHYDYYTGAPDRTDIGGAPAIPPGLGPNVRTVMQINVSGANGTAPVDDYNPATLTTLQTAFATDGATAGAFAAGQDPIVVGQAAYNSTYNRTFPTRYPTWGLSRISDTKLSFQAADGTPVTNFPMLPKAIHDEMGASFDDYGRMSAKLGLEVPFVNAAIANFILQNFVDPATEVVNPNKVQIWKITHNGVDTHPIHFHLFDVQVLNRVGWDGFIRLPDANELGWKDTVRISPLEDTIVALRPITPRVPFALPDSIRPLNPAAPLGLSDMAGFSNIDTATGNPAASPTLNAFTNFGYEYVWHCHILSHEENDMMRPIIFNTKAVADIFLRNTSTGQNVLWYFDGVARTGSAYLPDLTDQNWKFGGRGDFNGDGKLDIVWRNTQTGQNSVWYMDGIKRIGSAYFQALTDQNWKIAGVTDFNNDGKPDLVWRNTVTGQISAWYMNNVTLVGSAYLPTITDPNWKIVGLADFNSDGKSDILLRNTSNGQNVVWFMDGAIRTGSVYLPAETDQAWKIVGTGDFNGDVYNDILWRNTSNGQNRVWFMKGATRLDTTTIPAMTDQNWKILGNYYVYP